MDERAAVERLAGLAQEHRLRVFRLLLREGPEGLPAGLIALRLGVPASTMSSHLAQLERAGLLKSRREQRRILYAVDLEGIRHQLAFLIEDCCGGHPELSGYGRGGRLRDDHDLPQPGCGTSRNVLALIRNSGDEPRIIEYLKTPPSRAELVGLLQRMGMRPRELLRRKGTPYDELGLDEAKWTDDQMIDLMLEHPVLINRPIVVTARGVRLCRPSETVLEILPDRQKERLIDDDGTPVT